MKRTVVVVVALVLATTALTLLGRHQADPTPAADVPAAAASDRSSGFYDGEAGLSAAERVGREIWYKATAGNARFHTYVFQQRIGILVDWFRVLRADQRGDRFAAWGLINDPDCCVPGSDGCPARSLDETYGFEWCPGDAELLSFVGREGYRDPACDLADAPPSAADPHGARDQRQSTCDLAFGTSTGALGYRKFPNPRFDRDAWVALNGSPGSWEGYNRRLSDDPESADWHVRRLADGAVEPPFLIGTSCGSCHIAFDPLKPPADPANPAWANIKGAIGNQYLRISEMLASGMSHASLEYQVFAHARPGTSDTSAIPNDQVNNPGTINAITNFSQRPTFANEVVDKWRKVASCGDGDSDRACWCEPGREGKCWRKGVQQETVHHILKGGEDSIGIHEAIQRVYFNIGSCAEQCWVNHLTDLRQLDPEARNFGQTPFDIGQCRRDCPNFRAIEDRLGDIAAFLLSSEADATDLQVARENARKASNPGARYGHDDLVADLERRFGTGAVVRGQEVFAANCARCHSSLPESTHGPFATRDFRAIDPRTGRRADWLGNDATTFASEIGTNRCRALHSNHMAGHVWQEYGSETLRARPPDPSLREVNDGGRSYYRNISLLSLWAHAPFMLNNALGPEICGQPRQRENFFYRNPYVDADGKLLPEAEAPACRDFDPSVDGRFDLYVASMQDLLNPAQRVPKITRFDMDVPLSVGLRTMVDGQEKQIAGLTVVVPKGSSSARLGNFQHKRFFNDLVALKLRPQALQQKLRDGLGAEEGDAVFAELRQVGEQLVDDPEQLVATMRRHPKLFEVYSTCFDEVENAGHRFGEDLPDADKNALIAFLATL